MVMRELLQRPAAVAALLGAWLALILATHAGPRSPYTYAAQAAGIIQEPVTRTVNPDALTVHQVTRFFYDGTRPDWESAHNLLLPLHSFATSIVAAFVRPYMTANYVVNWLFLMLLTIVALRVAQRLDVRPSVMLLGLATIYALPAVIGFIGQPMHYIVGPVINYLVILAAMFLPERDLRNPLIAAALTAILTLNYDWYVFAAALAAYLLFVVRFDTRGAALTYVFLSALPLLAWKAFLGAISGHTISSALRFKFFDSVVAGWSEYVLDPLKAPLLPATVFHIGAHIALYEILAMIWWPLLACCAIALSGGQALLPVRTGRSACPPLLLLVIFFAVEQLATAAFDVENNPRRALPVLFAFAWAWCWTIDRHRGRKGWTIAFVALFALTAFLAFADVLLKTPAVVTLYMAETIREEPKLPMTFLAHRIEVVDAPLPQEALVRGGFARAQLGGVSAPFAIAQLFVGAWFFVLFWLLRRAELLPRVAPIAFAAIWLLSLVRFLW